MKKILFGLLLALVVSLGFGGISMADDLDEYTITFRDGSGEFEDVILTGKVGSTVTAEYPNWSKEGYRGTWNKSIPSIVPAEDVVIIMNWDALFMYFYDTGANITYIDTEGKVFTGIGEITFRKGDYSVTMLDRNLGALEVATGCNQYGCTNSGSYGYYFQWGNNYGFTPELAAENYIENQVNTENNSWSNPYVSGVFVSGFDNWSENGTQSLWGGEWDLSSWPNPAFDWFKDTTNIGYKMQGPCPEGYHVPSRGELGLFLQKWYDDFHASYAGSVYEYQEPNGLFAFRDDLGLRTLISEYSLIPYAGYISQISVLQDIGSYGYLWTSTQDVTLAAAGRFHFYWDKANNDYGFNKGAALPIRCFKDKGDSGFILSYDTRGGTLMQGQTIPSSGLAHQPGYNPKRTGHNFIGRYTDITFSNLFGFGYIDGLNPELLTGDRTIYARWDDDLIVTFVDYDGHELYRTVIVKGESVFYNVVPTRSGYTFLGWDKNLTNITEDLVVNAMYSKNIVSSGRGSSLKKDSCPNGDLSDSYYDGSCGKDGIKDEDIDTGLNRAEENTKDIQYSDEMNEAYRYAYNNHITTMDTIVKADMNGNLSRIAMAKMLSQYAINILGKTPDTAKKCEFKDVTSKMDKDYNDGVTLACQLGIMGINMGNNEFRPNDTVTRAEFGTALSRMLFQISDGTNKYYTTHLSKLKKEGIITNDDPDLQELRGYVMLMLMRSAK